MQLPRSSAPGAGRGASRGTEAVSLERRAGAGEVSPRRPLGVGVGDGVVASVVATTTVALVPEWKCC